MSIIFEKLKSLKNKSSESEEGQSDNFQHPKNIYRFNRLIFSPMGAFISFGILVGFGLITFYCLSALKHHLDSGISTAIVFQHRQPDILPDNGMLPQTDDALAPPLETDPASLQGTEPGQGIPASSNTSTKFNVPEYFHHLTKDIPDTEAVTIPEGIENHFLPSTKSIYTARAKQTQTFDHLLPTKGRDTALAEGIPTPQAAEHHPPGTNFSKITPSSQLKKTKPPERQAASPPEKIDTEKQTAERLSKQKKSRAVSAVATLSADLEDAIEKNDAPRINTLLAILARIQDKNSAYYLKLKAFKEIRDENYEAARKLLNKVLAKDKTDFEAGINMAIIEIKEQSFASAKKRLVRLRALYPSQGAIDDLLDML